MSSDFDDIDNADFSEEIPPSEGSVILHLLGQLRIGMSLSRVTLPTFILEQRSTAERFTDWMVHADYLRAMNNEEDPYLRCMHLCTWMVSGFHMGPRTPKKPYNALLGEVCRVALHGTDGSVIGTYKAEQVSHHPPVTAFLYRDQRENCCVWGHTEMRSKFMGNSIVAQMEHENTRINFELINKGETYTFNLPNMYGRGVLIGKLAMEIGGTVTFKCEQTGVCASIVFEEKPMFRGRYNKVHGHVGRMNGTKLEKVLEFQGRWSAYLKVTDKRSKRSWIPFDIRQAVPLEIVYPPLEEQTDYESKVVWSKVSQYMAAKEVSLATEHKLALEEKQRAERRYFEANNIEWKPQWFHWDADQQRYIPNDLDLTPYTEGEPIIEMPAPPVVPECIALAQEAGASGTITEVQSQAEETVQSILANRS